jgi:UDP:flavonoid glycosyltransferase YjiC (YdhE family)
MEELRGGSISTSRAGHSMRRICYYISDHGWGHATRSVAIIRELLSQDEDIQIIVKADYALKFIERSVKDKRVEFDRCRKDFGYASKEGSLQVDKERTNELLRTWLTTWDRFIGKEKHFCKEHDVNLIISDIAPQPFLVADSLSIPAIAISNFTWDNVYAQMFGDTREVSVVRDAYAQADLALVLPLAERRLPFQQKIEVGLVARNPTVSKRDLRQGVGLPYRMRLVYLGAGRIRVSAAIARSMLDTLSSACLSIRDVSFLVSSHVGRTASIHNAPMLEIPAHDPESQNYIAACDLVISKAGYSTVSEAIRGRVPMLLVGREGISEDESIIRTVEELGIARRISLPEEGSADLFSLARDSDNFEKAYQSLPERYSRDGNAEAASHILELISKK